MLPMKRRPSPSYLFGDNGNGFFLPRGGTSRKIALFLDFDGTLSPIREDPLHCALAANVRKDLITLGTAPDCSVAVVSGRTLRDVRERVGIATLYYAGNHGLDISGPCFRYTHPDAKRARPALRHLKGRLGQEVAGIGGVWLEDKKFGLSLHFRSAKREDIPRVKKLFFKIAGEFIEEGSLGLIRGKKVLELTPGVPWNKGSAVLLILRRLGKGWFPIYIGDDATDETAFAALGGKGTALRVGRSEATAARFYLRGQWEVPRVLGRIIRELDAPQSRPPGLRERQC